MVKLFLIIICAAGGYYAYEHYLGERPPTPRLAPEGTVYTLERSSAESDTGLVGIPAGTELKVASKGATETTVEYLGHRLNLPNTSLTRDLDAVDAVRSDEARRRRQVTPTKPTKQDDQKQTNPQVDRLKKDLLSVQDRMDDVRYRLKKIAVALEEKRATSPAETVSSHGLKEQQRTLEFELERLRADEGRIGDLIRRQMRD